jgi:preprotein translocase subunit SecD
MRIAGFMALAASLSLCAASGLVLVPSCAPAGVLEGLPRLSQGLDFQGGAVLTYELVVPDGVDPDVAADQAIEVLRGRLDAVGSAASVWGHGSEIRVEIPGTDAESLERTRGAIGRSSTLELRVVDDLSTVLDAVTELPMDMSRETETLTSFRDPVGGVLSTSYLTASGPAARAELERIVAALEPQGELEILLGRVESYDAPDPATAVPSWRTYVVERRVHVDGSMVADAFVSVDDMMGRPNVMIELDGTGREAFARMTTDAVKRRIAIVVDGEVMSAPLVQEPITGGRAQITLGSYMTYDELLREANDLVIMLRAGALPAPLELVDEAVVRATYDESVLAWLSIGSFLLLVVIVGAGALRYRSGTLALATPLPIVVPGLAVQALLGATLTLASIGGIGLAGLVGLIAGIVVAERVRRPESRVVATLVDASIAPAALLLFAAVGGVVYAATSGMARGFSTGLLVTSLAGAVPSLLWSGGVSAALRHGRRS